MPTGLHLAPLARHFIPTPFRRVLKQAYLQHKLDSVIGRVARLSHGESPSVALLEDLQDAWDNRGYGGRTDYLREVAGRAAAMTGPILECGSGLTTILVAALAGRRGVTYRSLEHLPECRDRVAGVLERHRLPVGVCAAPLRDFEGYSWYDPPREERPHRIGLVICDGPPGQTPGGRYGLLPQMRERLAPGATILLDDVDREGERGVLARWREEAGLQTEIRDTPTGAFGVAAVATSGA